MSTIQTIEIEAGKVLGAVQAVLPALEAAVPALAAAGGPIGLGVGAAAALLPLLEALPSGLISVQDQADLVQRIQSLGTAFGGKEWQGR
jgi:cation transporter-like permease